MTPNLTALSILIGVRRPVHPPPSRGARGIHPLVSSCEGACAFFCQRGDPAFCPLTGSLLPFLEHLLVGASRKQALAVRPSARHSLLSAPVLACRSRSIISHLGQNDKPRQRPLADLVLSERKGSRHAREARLPLGDYLHGEPARAQRLRQDWPRSYIRAAVKL